MLMKNLYCLNWNWILRTSNSSTKYNCHWHSCYWEQKTIHNWLTLLLVSLVIILNLQKKKKKKAEGEAGGEGTGTGGEGSNGGIEGQDEGSQPADSRITVIEVATGTSWSYSSVKCRINEIWRSMISKVNLNWGHWNQSDLSSIRDVMIHLTWKLGDSVPLVQA